MKKSYNVDDPLSDGVVEVLETSDLFDGKPSPRRGKIRDVYDMGNHMLIVTTDRISAYDVVYPTLIPHKGESLHALSAGRLPQPLHGDPGRQDDEGRQGRARGRGVGVPSLPLRVGVEGVP